MVKAIGFAVRDSAGGVARGSVAADAGSNFIQMGVGDEVSLNLARASIAGYSQSGDDLVITLIDGRQIVLDGYFNKTGEPNQLYLSQDGEVIAAEFTPAGQGKLAAAYGPADGWDKFSTLDDLRFAQADDLALQPVTDDDPAGMAAFLPGLMGLGGAGAALIGAGVIAGVVGGGGGDDETREPIPPTVNEPDSTHTVTTETDDKELEVSGTGEPGDKVIVVIGDETQETTIDDDGTWEVVFPETDLPDDGTYKTEVTFEHDDDTVTELPGPEFILDLTPPDVVITTGTKSVGDIENGEEYLDGVTIAGTGEIGADITVEVNGYTHVTKVSEEGTWTVTFTTDEIPAGEHEYDVTVTATDELGNDTVIHDVLVVDTVPDPITFDSVTADNTVNGTEYAGGFTISGTTKAGATLTVTIQGVERTVTAGSDGLWSINYEAGVLADGEYDTTVTATTTDAAGNSTTETHTFRVDTTTSVAFAPVSIAGDDVVNAAEAAAGVTMTGTAQPGATVEVSWGGVTLPATVAADGSWTVTFTADQITGGTYASTATVTATDEAGNTATATHAINVDTELSLTKESDSTGTDGVLNHVESGSGLTVTGTVDAGSTVMVAFGTGTAIAATVAADGSWTVTIPASQIPAGESTVALTISATDTAGNTATLTENVVIDTVVEPLTQVGTIAGDGVVNGTEHVAGIAIEGTVEAGSTVVITLSTGQTVNGVVDAAGNWTATFTSDDLPTGEQSVTYTVTATDAAGNVRILGDDGSLGFMIDTEAPAAPIIINDLGTGNQLNGIQVTQGEGDLTFYSIAADGTATHIESTVTDLAGDAGSIATFSTPVPDGSYLIVRDVDTAGNETSTLYIRNTDGKTLTLDPTVEGLHDFDFGSIDLSSSSASLTLTKDDLSALTGPDQELYVKGGSDDVLQLDDAVATGETRVVDGQTYEVYSLGTGTVLVDEDVNTSII